MTEQEIPCIFDATHTAQVRDFVHPQRGQVLRALYCEQCGKAALPTLRSDGTEGCALLDLREWQPLRVVSLERALRGET